MSVVAHPHGAGLQGLVGTDFRAWMTLRVRPRDIGKVVGAVRRFLWHCGTAALGCDEGGEAGRVSGYLAALRAEGRAVKTLWNHRTAISDWYEFLRQRGLVPADSVNPCRQVKLAKLPRRMPLYLEPGELAAALAAARAAGCWPEVALAAFAGLRLGEMARLRWADVDLPRRQLLIRETKSGRPKSVPLGRTALAALVEQRAVVAQPPSAVAPSSQPRAAVLQYVFPARHTFRGGFKYVDRPRGEATWARLFKPVQGAVPKFTACVGTGRAYHRLRHTFGSRGAQANVNTRKLASWMGHKDLAMVEVYQHLADRYDPDIEKIQLGSDELRVVSCEREQLQEAVAAGLASSPLPSPLTTQNSQLTTVPLTIAGRRCLLVFLE